MSGPTVELTTYALVCGHTAVVAGPCGAASGRAWCGVCGESAAVRVCEACGGPGPLFDCHGWYCQACRDQDGGDR